MCSPQVVAVDHQEPYTPARAHVDGYLAPRLEQWDCPPHQSRLRYTEVLQPIPKLCTQPLWWACIEWSVLAPPLNTCGSCPSLHGPDSHLLDRHLDFCMHTTLQETKPLPKTTHSLAVKFAWDLLVCRTCLKPKRNKLQNSCTKYRTNSGMVF